MAKEFLPPPTPLDTSLCSLLVLSSLSQLPGCALLILCSGCQKAQAMKVSYLVMLGSRRREEDHLWLDSDLSLLERLCCLPELGTWQSRGPITVSRASAPCVFTNPNTLPLLFGKHWRGSHLNLTDISLLEAACLRAWEARQEGRTALLSSS